MKYRRSSTLWTAAYSGCFSSFFLENFVGDDGSRRMVPERLQSLFQSLNGPFGKLAVAVRSGGHLEDSLLNQLNELLCSC